MLNRPLFLVAVIGLTCVDGSSVGDFPSDFQEAVRLYHTSGKAADAEAAFLELAARKVPIVREVLDPVFHQVGSSLLHNEGLQATWTTMYNSMFWRIADFNNTIVMGSVVVSLLAFVPLLLISNFLIKQYRSHFLAFINNSKIAKFIQSSKLVTRFSSMMES